VPKYTGSLGISFRFLKNFNLYLFGDWAMGHSVFNQTRQFSYNGGLGSNNIEKRKLDVQLGLVDPGEYGNIGVQPLTPGSQEYITAANRYAHLDVTDDSRANWIEKADFFGVREISLGYDASDLIAGVAGQYIRSLAIGVSARNVAIFTDYSGPDPEVNDTGSRGVERGTDFLTLQSPRTYNISLELGF
jgi:hypothetical protein